jgi:hypothetical protein
MDNDIKRLKHDCYKLAWYMRGGVNATELMYASDVGDLEILNRIVEENIETVKKTQMPFL